MLMKHLVAYVKQYWFLQKININECKLVQKPVKTSKSLMKYPVFLIVLLLLHQQMFDIDIVVRIFAQPS